MCTLCISILREMNNIQILIKWRNDWRLCSML